MIFFYIGIRITIKILKLILGSFMIILQTNSSHYTPMLIAVIKPFIKAVY